MVSRCRSQNTFREAMTGAVPMSRVDMGNRRRSRGVRVQPDHPTAEVTMTTTQDTITGLAARAIGVTKAYGSGATAVTALDEISVDIRLGRFTAIMGPSGSGKSTLMHTLAGRSRCGSSTRPSHARRGGRRVRRSHAVPVLTGGSDAEDNPAGTARARKLRLVLAGLAVVLGVMAVSAAMTATTTIGTGFTTLFQTVNSAVDVSVTGKPDAGSAEFSGKGFTPPVPESTLARVRNVPGAASVVGEVSADGARPVGSDGKVISLQGPPDPGWPGTARPVWCAYVRAADRPTRMRSRSTPGWPSSVGSSSASRSTC
jgi:energy-coupling factor transporter ATP-binding protein EcfA2